MEESTAFITSMTTWLTPTVLFIFLNLMIATILFTSNFPNKPPNQNDTVQPKLATSPSILHRLKSFTLYPPFSHQQDLQPVSPNPESFNLYPTRIVNGAPPQDNENVDQNPLPISANPERFDLDPTHFDFDPTHIETDAEPETDAGFVETFDGENDDLESLDEVYSKITGGHVDRTKSDTLPASGEVPVKLPTKMKKSASLKSAFAHFEEDKIVEARRPATVRERREAEDDDVEVDAKADDFINKFKHQLKLQRLDSIVRYKDMVNKRGGK